MFYIRWQEGIIFWRGGTQKFLQKEIFPPLIYEIPWPERVHIEWEYIPQPNGLLVSDETVEMPFLLTNVFQLMNLWHLFWSLHIATYSLGGVRWSPRRYILWVLCLPVIWMLVEAIFSQHEYLFLLCTLKCFWLISDVHCSVIFIDQLMFTVHVSANSLQ